MRNGQVSVTVRPPEFKLSVCGLEIFAEVYVKMWKEENKEGRK
jgi:hypothetical protein